MMVNDLDVLIVSYNNADALRACLASLRDVLPEARVRVLDNDSPDASAGMVAEEFPDVDLVRSPTNTGFGAAVNVLVQRATSEHVLLLNPDVVMTENVVPALVSALRDDPSAVVAGPRIVYPDGRLQHSAQLLPDLRLDLAQRLAGTKAERLIALGGLDVRRVIAEVREPSSSQETRSVPFLWATCWLMRRAEALALGPFDDRFPLYDEDVDFCLRLVERGRTALYVPAVSITHVGGGSSDSARKRMLTYQARARLYRVHRGRAHEAAFRLVASGVDAVKRLRRA